VTIARYSFLPWLRRGIGNNLQRPAGAGAARAALDVGFTARSDVAAAPLPPVAVELVGPGDIAVFYASQVIRTEPRAGVTDFEANYLCAVDFYDEDWPWRYAPLAPDLSTHRLTPWITLVALKDDEFERRSDPGRPLAAFDLTPGAKRENIFPVAGQEHAWAHVHLNDVIGSGTAPDVDALEALITSNPDIGYARLLSPRQLEPDTAYTAIITATFEVGRRAGLGEAVADTDDGLERAWTGPATLFPIYYEWRFRTGIKGDFESLVRALVPRDLDPRVGVRPMSIAEPGFGITAAVNPPDDKVGLEGALLAPTTVRRGLGPGSDFATQIADVVNAPAAIRDDPNPPVGSDDPLVAPPIHGCWHAGVDQVSASGTGWVDALNVDPRHRAAAGLGARVIRRNQERYMRLAWEQVGDVVRVNHTIRRLQLATKASAAAFAKSLNLLPPADAVALSAPVFARIMGSPQTLRSMVGASRLSQASLSPAARKLLRPRGPMARRLLTERLRPDSIARLATGLSDGSLSALPPAPVPGGATFDAATDALQRPRWQRWLISHLWLVAALTALILLPVIVLAPTAALVLAVATGVGAAGAFLSVRAAAPEASVAGLLGAGELTPQAIAVTPARPDFELTHGDSGGVLPPPLVEEASAISGDSPAARDLRRALIDFHGALATRVSPPAQKPVFDLMHAHRTAIAALEPHQAMRERFGALLRVGASDVMGFAAARYRRPPKEDDVLPEIMNHPDIKDPMYAPLADIDDDYFVPNLSLIPNNTISLMATNQQFIESYLIGLNHEFARELLWREYPTDQRGSVFRQFWDVSTYVDREDRDAKTLAEALKDIPKIHGWSLGSRLGGHNQRDAEGDAAQVMLVLRGDLLKRYPNTYIYAQKAGWGSGRRENRLVLADETGELFSTNSKDPRLRYPLYRARVAPDLHFIGFDLTLDEVRGDPRLEEAASARALVGDETGWFFVLQEVVGEPRFGLDVTPPTESAASRWDNLAWTHLDLTGGQRIDLSKPLGAGPGVNGGLSWGSNAADMAAILYQKPVMVGVHGSKMLAQLRDKD
jgi:hypothetical protein